MSAPTSRALTATVIAVASPATSAAVIRTMSALSAAAGVRAVTITLGDNTEPPRRDERGCIVIEGLVRRYLNNAVASLRLSSLPSLAWWRAADVAGLPELAGLLDRVVMDMEEPADSWALVPRIAEEAAISDLRWARLTRWRELFAQFFDSADVRAAASSFERIELSGADVHDARLLGGWFRSCLRLDQPIEIVTHRSGAARLESARLTGPQGNLEVRLLANGSSLETVVALHGAPSSTRVVALGEQGVLGLLGEELRVRTRDLAFEAAVRATGEKPA